MEWISEQEKQKLVEARSIFSEKYFAVGDYQMKSTIKAIRGYQIRNIRPV